MPTQQPALCKICHSRRAKRACPAVGGDICTVCCGTEREVSLTCPLDCEYLREAHRHEKTVPVPETDLAYPEVTVTEEFVTTHQELVLFAVSALLEGAFRTPGAYDSDVLEALAGLVQTHRTLDSGLIYESYSPNPVAASIQRSFSSSLAEYENVRREREALSPLRNSDVVTTLVFLQRVGVRNLNGRPRGRMFMDLLRQMTPATPAPEPASRLII